MVTDPEELPAYVSHWQRHATCMNFKLRSKMYSDPVTLLPEVSPTSHLRYQRKREPNDMNRNVR